MSLPIEGDVWGGDTTIHEAHLKFKVTHTYIGDVRIKLVSPAGEAIEVFKGKGRAKNEVFDQNISHLIGGRVGLGEWKVIVEDVSRRDTGSIDSFELQLSPAKFVCE
jgi:subtilisin-like proprotein convertase family protein